MNPAREVAALLVLALFAPKARALDGRVILGDSSDGPPAAGAEVLLYPSMEAMFGHSPCPHEEDQLLLDVGCDAAVQRLVERYRAGTLEAKPLARTTSARDGTFRFEGVKREAGNVIAVRKGDRSGHTFGPLGDDGLVMLPRPSPETFGKVLDDHGAPVKGAEVVGVYVPLHAVAVRSDAKGAFKLPPTPDQILVLASGFAPQQVFGVAPADSNDVELHRVQMLSGTVRDAHGPVAGATVSWLESPYVATTGADGRFSIERSPSSYELRVIKDARFATAKVRDDEPVSLVLVPAASLRVANPERRRCKEVSLSQGSYRHFGEPQADGSYLFPAISPGDYRLRVDCDGRMRLAEELRLAAGPATQRRVPQEAGVSITGDLVDDAGRPIGFAELQVESAAAAPDATGGWDACTDERGHFEVPRLPPGAYRVSTTGGWCMTDTTDPVGIVSRLATAPGGVHLVAPRPKR